MQPIPFTVRVASGDGLIARFGEVVMYAVINDDPAAGLLAAAASAARNPRPGAVLADELAPAAFGEARGVDFGALVPSSEGTHLLLRGRVTARVETQQGAYRLSGDSDPQWVRQLLPSAVLKAELSSSHSGPIAIPHTDLWAGVVGGGGFVLLGAAASASVKPETDVTEQMSPSPGVTATQLAPRAAAAPVQTVSASTTAGVLSTPDGAVYLLDRSYVVGRAPLTDDAVRNATASPIVVQYDPYVSRVHAYITVDRGEVFVHDAATTAGTFVAAPGAAEWTQIGTTPTRLEPGWSMRIGEWIVTYRAGTGP